MLGMNKSNPTSLLRSIQFLDQNWLSLKKVWVKTFLRIEIF
jgi:hypothetical protein